MNDDRPANCGRQPCSADGQRARCAVTRRKREDIVFVGIEVLPTERDALIRIGLLNQADRNDKLAVLDAVYAFFERHLDPEPPPPE